MQALIIVCALLWSAVFAILLAVASMDRKRP
jgi:hypothetical protein